MSALTSLVSFPITLISVVDVAAVFPDIPAASLEPFRALRRVLAQDVVLVPSNNSCRPSAASSEENAIIASRVGHAGFIGHRRVHVGPATLGPAHDTFGVQPRQDRRRGAVGDHIAQLTLYLGRCPGFARAPQRGQHGGLQLSRRPPVRRRRHVIPHTSNLQSCRTSTTL